MSNIDRNLSDPEFSRVAEKLVKTRGVSSGAHVDMKIKEMEATGDEENKQYWEKVSEEVEKLLYET